MSSTPVHSRHLLVRLQHDWDHIKRSRGALRQARRWCLVATPIGPHRPLESLDDVLAWAGYGCAAGNGGDDHVLGNLVRLAVTDQLAARVVLQRLLPGISTMARRRTGRGRPYHQVLDEVVATAWTVIRTYPIDRRHTYVAVGMLREIDYQSFRRARRRLTTFVPRPLHTFDVQPAPVGTVGPADELRDLLEDAATAGFDPADIELARRLGRGETTRQIAQETNVTDRTVRNKRDAVTYRLRALALASA
jgi:DNA-directed RNA polymerase specialized sigma24 family protein